MRTLILAFFVLAALSAQASKDKGVYIGGSVSLVNVGVNDPFSNEVTFKTGEVLLGYKYNRYLGAEIRRGQSLQEEVISVDDPNTGLEDTVTASLDSYFSYYYRAELANEIAKIYFLLGQSSVTTQLEFDESGRPDYEASESGLSYGVGFGLWLDERMNLNFEFKNLVSTDTDNFTSGSISADYRF
ncbi:MAG: porin family protein [Agarilytica sp.]